MTVVDTVDRTIRWRSNYWCSHHGIAAGYCCQLETTRDAVLADVRSSGVKPVSSVGEISRRVKELKAVATDDVAGHGIGHSSTERFHADTKATDTWVKPADIRLEQPRCCLTGRLVGVKLTGRGWRVCTDKRPIAGVGSRCRTLWWCLESVVHCVARVKPTVDRDRVKSTVVHLCRTITAVQQCRVPHSKHLLRARRLRRRWDWLTLHFSFRNSLRRSRTVQRWRRYCRWLSISRCIRPATTQRNRYILSRVIITTAWFILIWVRVRVFLHGLASVALYCKNSVMLRECYITRPIITTQLLTSKLSGVRFCLFSWRKNGTVQKTACISR